MNKTTDTIPVSNTPAPKPAVRRKTRRVERIVLLLTIGLVILAWVYAYLANGTDIAPLVPEVIPGTVHVERDGELYIGLDENHELLG